MKDIICKKCNKGADMHRFTFSGNDDTCGASEADVLRAHIAKLEAVVEAARELDRKMQGFTLPTSALSAAQELVDALAVLDSTNVS